MRVLVVEDNAEVREFVAATLREDGHAVLAEETYSGASARIAEGGIAAIVLDWMLPDGSGLDLCRGLRRQGNAVPILMLTARSDVEDRVSGLDAGADDYLKKPFAAAELRARVRSLLRRGPRLAEAVVRFGTVEVRTEERRVLAAGKELPLTAREFDILETLVRQRGRVLSRSSLLVAVWGVDDEGAAASLEVLIARIRRKLAAAGAADFIKTHRGVGYSVEGPA